MDDEETRIEDDGPEEEGQSLREGQHFEEYRVERLLGRGGMGEVYEVAHRSLGTRHALKLIHPRIVDQADSAERFLKEAKTMAQLLHPNIVHVDGFRKSGRRAWLRMELVSGETASLAELMKQPGPMPEKLAREILRQLLEGLVHAHGHGAMHRDLKPAHILLEGIEAGGAEQAEGDSAEGVRVKITDFGLVEVAGEEWLQTEVHTTVAKSLVGGSGGVSDEETVISGEVSLGTSSRALVGTSAFMSPEQKRGEKADARSDLYAVGLMAYQMLTGEESLGFDLPSELVAGLHSGWDA